MPLTPGTILRITPFLPLLGCLLILLLPRTKPRCAAGVGIATTGASLLGSILLWCSSSLPLQVGGTWLTFGSITLPFGFFLDPTSLLMLTLASLISFLVQCYSVGYMAGDPGFSRYYAFLALFTWAMESLSVSSTLFQLYIFWELVGLSSYLLIGFWYQKGSASQAGKKAFVMTRAGDVAFFLGILLLLVHAGNLEIPTLNNPAGLSPALITLSTLLIFGGIIGKSAQFPLMTWLPDAMEGPTPVSALLHSATMVAAGVFLFARLFPLFTLSPTTMAVCLVIGTLSMLLAATMAMTAKDIKQVLAFSTISQLGFMIMGLAAGSKFAGLFHLTTHAGFKALLFLCAGVFIHHFGTNDMRDIGKKGARGLTIPMACLLLGSAALSGIPPFSGFFSKESILGALFALPNPFWLGAAMVSSFLTAYYSFRMVFLLLFPEEIEPHKGHGPGGAMIFPLLVLGGLTLCLGFFKDPLSRFLGAAEQGHMPGMLILLAVLFPVAGIVLSFLEFGPNSSRKGFVERIPSLCALFSNRWYLDRLHEALVRIVVDRGLSRLFAENDRKVIDGGVDGMGKGIVFWGTILSLGHRIALQPKLLVMFAVVAGMALYVMTA